MKNELMEVKGNESVENIFGLENNKIMDRDFVGELTAREVSFCSLKATDQKGKIALFNAQNNPDKHISDCINEVIKVTDIFVEKVTCKRADGQEDVCPRVVLIDEKGQSYQSVSMGIFSALKKLISVFGVPHWEEPISLKIKQLKKGQNSILTFEVVA